MPRWQTPRWEACSRCSAAPPMWSLGWKMPWSSGDWRPDPGMGGYATPRRARRSAGHLADHRRARRARNLDAIPTARPGDIHPRSASPRNRPVASQRDIQLHRPTGREWTVRSLCRRARSTALSARPDPRPGFAGFASGPYHPISGRRPATPVFNARRLHWRGRSARRRAARAGRRFGHECAVSSDQF